MSVARCAKINAYTAPDAPTKYLVGSATVPPRDPKMAPAKYNAATLRLPSHPGCESSKGRPWNEKDYDNYDISTRI